MRSLYLLTFLPFAACNTIPNTTVVPPTRTVVQTRTVTVPAPVCDTVFTGIAWSENDTPETIREVKAHNAAYKAYCAKERQ